MTVIGLILATVARPLQPRPGGRSVGRVARACHQDADLGDAGLRLRGGGTSGGGRWLGSALAERAHLGGRGLVRAGRRQP